MSRGLVFCAAVLAVLAFAPGRIARADVESDWQTIVALDAGAPKGPWASRDEARAAALDYMAKQERALHDFLASHPGDTHEVDADLRLAHLLSSRGDLEQDPAGAREAEAIFSRIEHDQKFASRQADVAFARLSLLMQRLNPDSAEDRMVLLAKAQAFAKAFPQDHRVAPLFVEVASVFPNDPKTAKALLEKAQPLAGSEAIRARISDDLKRLALLGKPLTMKWTSIQGKPVDLEKMRGKVVLIFYFASWSAPSMAELDWVRGLAAGREDVETLGVCLDPDPVTVPSMLAEHQVGWPVYCDGRGWLSPLVRGFGINALPALWVVDREGVLRSLDAKQNADALITRLLHSPGE